MRSPATSATSATPTTTKAMKFAIATIFLLLAILFGLFFRAYFFPQASISPSHLSLRQHQGNIQWKLISAKDTDSNWHTITTISALTGKDGKDGKDGQDGTDGQNGANGTNGSDGVNGQNGTNGQSGPQGEQGEQGIQGTPGPQGEQGLQGNQGQSGVNGNDGQDGTDGRDGADGRDGIDGQNGQDGINGTNGVDGTNGLNGREIELQKDLYFIQWRYVGEPGWRNLIAYSELKGDKGDTGATGPANTLTIGSVTKPSDCIPTASITGTAPNQTLNLGIPGLPSGGVSGQVLTKNSSADCDAIWANTNVIVGTGRPDVSASMDAGTQAKVASATSGTEFRSTDGPQGAWVWMKQGSSWVVTSGDTGDVDFSGKLLNGWQVGVGGRVTIRRWNSLLLMNIILSASSRTSSRFLDLPIGYRLSDTTDTYWQNGATQETGYFTSNMGFLNATSGSKIVLKDRVLPANTSAWPTTLTP